MKFRKKPVVIEAVTWYGKYTSPGEWPDWFNDAVRSGVIRQGETDGEIRIKTLEGELTAESGSIIIQGVRGEIYPCRWDVFDATYEPVYDHFDPAQPKAAKSIP
jgi:hypothetical protein